MRILSRKRVIVGLDPGIYTALVILDLKGNVIFECVGKELGEREVVKTIAEIGKPIIVATDVRRVPKLVKKTAARFNAKVFKPSKDLPVKLKHKSKEDPHLRDAYTAAIMAYKHYENTFRSIEKEEKDEEKREIMKENIVFGRKRRHGLNRK